MTSLDFGHANGASQHSPYGQPDLHNSYPLHSTDNVGAYPPSLDVGLESKPTLYHQDKKTDDLSHSNYDLFSNNTNGQSHFSSQRYRTNSSSSSSLPHNYGMNDGLYQQNGYNDTVAPYGSSNSNPYDMINGLPSSYGTSKVSPLTPNDPVGGIHHAPFPPSINTKDFAPNSFDMNDRRMPMVSPSDYASEYPEDYGSINGINNGLAFPPSNGMQNYQNRYAADRYNPQHPAPPLHPQNGPVQPHAFRDGNGYGEGMHYIPPSPHQDLPVHMSVNDTLARMKLQGSVGATDLQSFIA